METTVTVVNFCSVTTCQNNYQYNLETRVQICQEFPTVNLYFPQSDIVSQISNSFHSCSRMDKETPAAEHEVLEEDQEHNGEGDMTDAKPDRKGRFVLFGR